MEIGWNRVALSAEAAVWRTDTGAEVMTLDSPSCQLGVPGVPELGGS